MRARGSPARCPGRPSRRSPPLQHVADQHHGACHARRDRAHQHVIVANVCQLVGHNGLELFDRHLPPVTSSHIPRVTHTTAFFGFRPVAKAFGCICSEIATTGIGIPAFWRSRSTIV
jgi:hypothetical protein